MSFEFELLSRITYRGDDSISQMPLERPNEGDAADLFGEVGEFQSLHKVYDREGEACRRCRSTIVRVKANGRSSFLCPQCQV